MREICIFNEMGFVILDTRFSLHNGELCSNQVDNYSRREKREVNFLFVLGSRFMCVRVFVNGNTYRYSHRVC